MAIFLELTRRKGFPSSESKEKQGGKVYVNVDSILKMYSYEATNQYAGYTVLCLATAVVEEVIETPKEILKLVARPR